MEGDESKETRGEQRKHSGEIFSHQSIENFMSRRVLAEDRHGLDERDQSDERTADEDDKRSELWEDFQPSEDRNYHQETSSQSSSPFKAVKRTSRKDNQQ